MTHGRAKYFSPVQPWCGGKLGRAPRFMAWRCSLGEWTSVAHVRAKYFSPVHPWCGGGWRVPRFGVWRCVMVGRLRINGARRGEIFFARINAANGYIGYAPRFMVWRCLTVGQKDINGARRGEIFFARTTVVRGRVAGVPPQCVGDCASTAHVGAKYFSPVHMRRVVTLGGRHDLGCGHV